MHPRDWCPCYPIAAMAAVVDVRPGTAGSTATIAPRPSPTAGLMVTVGVHNAAGIVPAPWPAAAEVALFAGGMRLPLEPPPSHPHPAAARSFAMVDISAFVAEAVPVACQSLSWSGVVAFCWCEHVAPALVVREGVRCARLAAGEFASRVPLFSKPTVDDDDDLVEVAAAREQEGLVTLRCPLSHEPLEVPGRGRFCSHLACFDISRYIASALHIHAWNCPICNAEVRFDEAVLASDVVEAMGVLETEGYSGVPCIYFSQGGRQWTIPDGVEGDGRSTDDRSRR